MIDVHFGRQPGANAQPHWHGGLARGECHVSGGVAGRGECPTVSHRAGQGHGQSLVRRFTPEAVAEPGSRAAEEVRITAQKLSRLPIDAKQGGQFIEPLCSLIPSLASAAGERVELRGRAAVRLPIGPKSIRRTGHGILTARCRWLGILRPGQRVQRRALPKKIEIARRGRALEFRRDGFAIKKGLRYRSPAHAR